MNDNGKSKSLQLAMQEFEDFKKGKALPAPVTERAALPRTPQYADKMLYCATHAGLAAQMILKLSPGKAEITEVRKLAHMRACETHNGVSGEKEKILKTHKLDLGRFEECPHCCSEGIVFCGNCGTLSCLGPDENRHHCPCCARVTGTRLTGISLPMATRAAPQSEAQAADKKALPRKNAPFMLGIGRDRN